MSPAMPEHEPAHEHHSVPPDNVGSTSKLDLDPTAPELWQANMRKHFEQRLGDKWDCDTMGHTVCVLTVDGGHHQLSEENITLWVNALCRGEATTAQPPEGVLISNSTNDHSKPSTPRAVSISPSRRRHINSPILAASVSLRQSLEYRSYSSSSTRTYGPEYRGGQALEWLGTKVLHGIEEILIRQRVRRNKSHLRRWSKDPIRNTDKAYKVLENVLDMLRCDYYRIHTHARRVTQQVNRYTEDSTSQISAVIDIIDVVYDLMMPGRGPPEFEDLAYDVIDLMIRSPLSLQGPEDLANVLNTVLREVAYAPRSEKGVYLGEWVSEMLPCIQRLSPKAIFNLDSINQLRTRRLHSRNDDPESCNPWELEIFMSFEFQDPSFRDIVSGPHGVPGLFLVVESLLYHDTLSGKEWRTLADIIQTLDRMLRVKWVCDTAGPKDIKILVETLGRALSEKSMCNDEWLPYFALSNLKHMISNSPPMVAVLIANGAGTVIKDLPASGLAEDLYTYTAREVLRQMDQWTQPEKGLSGDVEGTIPENDITPELLS